MQRILAAIILAALAPYASADCHVPGFPNLGHPKTNSFQTYRAILLTSGFFPMQSKPKTTEAEVLQNSGMLEIFSSIHNRGASGIFGNWISPSGQRITVFFPTDRQPFVSDCPPQYRR
jgi:hypothetical protein